ETYRLADPAALGIIHDQMASYTGRWALMEVQLGQVNWSGYPVLLYPGAVRLWLWTAYAHGSEFITVYRYRQPRFGTELFHAGLVGPDGVAHSEGGREFIQVIDELKLLAASESTKPAPQAPARRLARNTPGQSATAARVQPALGLILDFDQLWCFKAIE